jgi:hypothetical protein
LRAVLGGVRDTHDERVRGAGVRRHRLCAASSFRERPRRRQRPRPSRYGSRVSVPENDERGTDARNNYTIGGEIYNPAPQRRV